MRKPRTIGINKSIGIHKVRDSGFDPSGSGFESSIYTYIYIDIHINTHKYKKLALARRFFFGCCWEITRTIVRHLPSRTPGLRDSGSGSGLRDHICSGFGSWVYAQPVYTHLYTRKTLINMAKSVEN